MLTPNAITRLEKAATDNGFDVALPPQGDWLAFASSQTPAKLWLSSLGDALYLVAVSQPNVVRAMSDVGTALASPLPSGAAGARSVVDLEHLHRAVRRAFLLSRTLPDELLRAFEKSTANLPRSTEAERLVVQRIGQDLFRAGLLDFWDGRCAITGLAVPELLRASHIKPWADCESDAERLDVFNGLLLAAHLDAAFDRGFVTVEDDGRVVVADALDEDARRVLGLEQEVRVRKLEEGHRTYLPWHRDRVFCANMFGGLPSGRSS